MNQAGAVKSYVNMIRKQTCVFEEVNVFKPTFSSTVRLIKENHFKQDVHPKNFLLNSNLTPSAYQSYHPHVI